MNDFDDIQCEDIYTTYPTDDEMEQMYAEYMYTNQSECVNTIEEEMPF